MDEAVVLTCMSTCMSTFKHSNDHSEGILNFEHLFILWLLTGGTHRGFKMSKAMGQMGPYTETLSEARGSLFFDEGTRRIFAKQHVYQPAFGMLFGIHNVRPPGYVCWFRFASVTSSL